VLEDDVSSQDQVDADVLVRFQALASTLISQTNESLGLGTLNDTGLECSQQRWHLRNSKIVSSTDSVDNISETHFSAGSDVQLSEAVHPQPPDPGTCLSRGSIRQEMDADTSSVINRMVIRLMAGAVFAIVLIFLQCSFPPTNSFINRVWCGHLLI